MKSKDKIDHRLIKKIKEGLRDHEFGSMEENWNKMRNKLAVEIRTDPATLVADKPVLKRRILNLYGIAASLLLLAGLSVFIIKYKHKTLPLNSYITQNNIGRTELSDGSVVWINRYSEIRYSDRFAHKERVVHLTGEAFFEIATDDRRPFRIFTPSAEIKVVGTTFNVKAYPAATQEIISVNSGIVGFRRIPEERNTFITLHAGETIILNKQDSIIEKKKTDDPNYCAWKSKIFEFKDTPMLDVARRLEEAYGCKVVFQTPALDSVGLNATFNDVDLNIILQTIALTLDLEIIEQNDTILISEAK